MRARRWTRPGSNAPRRCATWSATSAPIDGGAVPQNDLARAQDDLKKAEIALAARQQGFRRPAEPGRRAGRAQQALLAERQRAVVAEVQRQVDALTLRAPFDGQVGQVQVPQGTNVIANGPVLSVVDLSRFEVEMKVPESFARDLAIGMPAQITSAGTPFPARSPRCRRKW
jgi:HlyD family secretion protein